MKLYCLLYKDGRVKVGRAGWIKARFKSLAKEGHIVRSWTSCEIAGPIIETKALKILRRIANTTPRHREWFVNLPFGLAVHVCEQMSRRHPAQ